MQCYYVFITYLNKACEDAKLKVISVKILLSNFGRFICDNIVIVNGWMHVSWSSKMGIGMWFILPCMGMHFQNDADKSDAMMDMANGFQIVDAEFLGSDIREAPWLNYCMVASPTKTDFVGLGWNEVDIRYLFIFLIF